MHAVNEYLHILAFQCQQCVHVQLSPDVQWQLSLKQIKAALAPRGQLLPVLIEA